jgi:hypothetical protein
MANVNATAPAGQDSDTSGLCWGAPGAARPWLSSVKSLTDDALAAILDQMLPIRQRRLGHVEAERIIQEAAAALAKAFDHAERGLPPAP